MAATTSNVTLEELVDGLTVEGELYARHDDGSLTCYACGHRCLIKPGRRGICKVRFNQDGVLKVPWGYVGALQCDPTEKKPFFHVYPGSDTLTFGMLGCDFHCPYCVAPNTRLATSEGPKRIDALFAAGQPLRTNGNDEVRRPTRWIEVYSHTGQARQVQKLFRHPYQGKMMRIRPWYLPSLECTPEHEFFVADTPPASGASRPHFVRAEHLKPSHLLAIPKQFSFSRPVVSDTAELLRPIVKPYQARRTIGRDTLAEVMQLSAEGISSREIGARIGKDASHVRHLRSKLNRGEWDLERLGEVDATLTVEKGRVRLPKEHRPGLPLALPLNAQLAKLLGYYCAEGCVSHSKDRVHAATLNFSFGHHEEALADEVVALLRDVFGVHTQKVYCDTTIGIAVDKASLALCFEALCGHSARTKRVPPLLYQAPRKVVESFLHAYVAGDGSTHANGLVCIGTVSEELACGVAWLVLKLGMLPSFSAHPLENRPIVGRQVNSSPYVYNVSWYFDRRCRRFAYEDENYWYIRIREVETFDYAGDVYNLEVEGDHSYLANLISTHNCQNWITSQALRDSASEMAGAQPMPVTPHKLVALAKQQGAQLVGSSYNEPLITSEWAVAVFKEAVQAGLKCVYISNGNATRETLEYIRPHVVGYKIDLKSMSKKGYQRLGGVLENTLNGIRMVHEMGFWLEIVTLIVPGFNDSDDELRAAAKFLADLSPDIPWHVTAFHKDYKMTEPDNTTAQTLLRAARIGQAAGLRYVYAGNLPGQVGEYEHTFCPNCKSRLIERYGYIILDYRLTAQGTCPDCGTKIAGLWTDRPETVRLYGPGRPRAVTSVINRFRSDIADI